MLPGEIARGIVERYRGSSGSRTAPFVTRRRRKLLSMPDGNPTNAWIADRLTCSQRCSSSPTHPLLQSGRTCEPRSSSARTHLGRATVRAGRVRELRGIGPGIEAKLRELVETGEIAELHALEAELNPALDGLGRMLGLTAERDASSPGISVPARSASSRRRPAAVGFAGPGRRPRHRGEIVAALARGPAAPRGLTLARSRALSQEIATALDGAVAGTTRRFCELSHDLTVVCASDDPMSAIARFEQLPAIVALLERTEWRAVGLTVDGVPVTLVVTPTAQFGTELFRATGSAAYVDAVAPLPDAASEAELFERLGLAYCPPELREHAGATAPVGLVELEERGDLHRTRPGRMERTRSRKWRERHWGGGTSTSRSAITPPTSGSFPVSTPMRFCVRPRRSIESTRCWPLRVLRGVECDIRSDGSLDLEDSALESLDWVQLSLHAGQRRGGDELTRVVTRRCAIPTFAL